MNACGDSRLRGLRSRKPIGFRQWVVHDLASGKKISAILAPAFLANYPKEYQRVLGYLKSKGVSHIKLHQHGT